MSVKSKAVVRNRTSGAGRSSADLVRVNNKWRENYNPLRGLILSRVVSLLEAGERGEFADLQWLYRFVERRFPPLRALRIRRQSAVEKLDWEVNLVCEAPEPAVEDESPDQAKKRAEAEKRHELAQAQADFLKGRYEKIENLKEAIGFLTLAEFRGFAHLQKHRDADGCVYELHWLPQWNFVRDGLFGDWFWNPEARQTAFQSLESNRIDPAEFIIREVEMPINEIGVIAFVRSNLSQKDWDAFVEIFGLSGCVVIMPGQIPQGQESAYQAAAEKIAEGGSGALPAGGDAKFPASGVRGSSPFKEHLEWQEKDVVLAGTGGKLTMLTGPTGLGGGQAEVHEDVFDEIATAEAGQISEVFQKQFDKPELAAAFPGQPVLAYFTLKPVDKTADETLKFRREVFARWQADGTVSDVLANQTDMKALTEDVDLPVNEEYIDPYLPVVADGVPVTGEVLKDSEGDIVGGAGPVKKDLTADDAENADGGEGFPKRKPQFFNRKSRIADSGSRMVNRGPLPGEAEVRRMQTEVASALARDMGPVMERLDRILQIEDPEILRGRLAEFTAEVERLKADVGADPELGRALERILAAGVAKGLSA